MTGPTAFIWVDGAARGNPGPAAMAVVIKDSRGRILASLARCLGVSTNNQAEYRALIAGLEQAISLGFQRVAVRSDSELVVKQLQGKYRVKTDHLKPLHRRAVQLAGQLEHFTISHIPREQNREADALANKALDAAG